MYNPVGAAVSAGSQVGSAVTSPTPIASLLQNLQGSLSQSQLNAAIAQCIQGVQAAGGTDNGECANQINAVVAQANAMPVTLPGITLPSGSTVSSWLMWAAFGHVGFLVIYEMMT
jgi:hypothetical protein